MDKGLRFNEGKSRHDLVPAFAQEQYARVLTKGAEKYAERNWEQGMKWSKVISSLERHVQAWKRGEDYDPETGLLHSAHIMCNAAFLTEYYKIYPQGDDRPHNYLKHAKIGLDIDEVICDFVGGWHKKWGADPSPQWWNYHRGMGSYFAKMKKTGTLDKFYLSLKPKISPSEIPFEPHCYVTSRPVDSSVTEEWLQKHGFPSVKVYTVALNESKIEVIKNAGVDIFIDDGFHNFVELNRAGICTFLMTANHNKRYNVGYKRINSLMELL